MKNIKVEEVKQYENKKKFYEQFQESLNQKYLPRNEMDLLLEHIATKEVLHRKRNYLMFRLLLSMGCRIKEFSLIEIKHIDLNKQLILIPSANTKTKKSRIIRVNNKLFLDLKDYILENNIKSGFLFSNKLRNPFSTRNYNLILESYYIDLKSKIKFKPHAHTFRHSHIIYSLDAGVPLPAVMKQVGHIRLTTTQIYSNYVGTHIKEAYKEVDF